MHPEQKYNSLGGWLLGFFIFTIISLVWSLSYIMFFSVLDGFFTGLTGYYGTSSSIVPVYTYIFQFLICGLMLALLIMIGTRNRNFLLVYMLLALVNLGAGINSMFHLANDSFWGEFLLPFSLSAIALNLAFHISWLVYFVRSRRVYVYMRSDEYLKRSLVFARVKRPEPEPYMPPPYPTAYPYGAPTYQQGYYSPPAYGAPPAYTQPQPPHPGGPAPGPGYGAPPNQPYGAQPPAYPTPPQPPYTQPGTQGYAPTQQPPNPGAPYPPQNGPQPPYGQG